MGFVVHEAEGKAGDRSGPIYHLTDEAGSVRAEVWPAWGFNCLRWQVRMQDGRWADIIYSAPDWELNPVPTRSGHPILFPFPGRLREGKLPFEGKIYQLPLTDSTKENAIHGFTPRNRWRVAGMESGGESASVTGAFQLDKDLPAELAHWPADFNFEVTYRLFSDRLRVEATVENLGSLALPFGLGYHPYFRLPGVADADIGGHYLQANVDEVWESVEVFPTGNRLPVPDSLDFRQPRAIGGSVLDNVLTGVSRSAAKLGGLVELGVLSHPSSSGRLRVLADPAFRELVLFIPAHRQAVTIEPYTCSADASNLAKRGIDSGWRTIAPGEEWSAAVEYRWEVREL